jgi:hypothetical protein
VFLMQHYRARRQTGHPVQLLFGVLLAIAAVAVIGYFLLEQLRNTPTGQVTEPKAAPTAREGSATGPAPPGEQAATAPGRTSTILTCTAANGQVFYTNATRCEDADLENRINVLETPELPASRPGTCLGAQAGGAELQRFLPMCRESFDAALALEPFLLELDDVSGSRALRRYCAFITEGVQAGCMATSDQFCFLPRCQGLRESVQP